MMFRWLVVLIIVLPALEIWTLIRVGRWIGGFQTFGLILLTGFLGAYLAKREAGRVWQYAKQQMAIGQVPTTSILDGICIFAGGLFLLTPGFITDAAGFLLVFPLTRPIFRQMLLFWIQKKIEKGDFYFNIRR